MIWLSWRQQRLETIMAAALFALVAVLLVPVGLHMASVYSHGGAAACVAHPSGSGCGGIVNDFLQRFEHSDPIVPWLNFVPGLFGILFAAPLVLELEQGTFRLAWTQSVTRRRWLTVKLATIYGSGLLAAFALATLMTWWREPLDRLQGRMDPNVFDFEGIAPYAYTVFALSLVLALGIFTRRTLVATAGSLLAYFGLRIGIQGWVREHYVSPVKVIWRPGTAGPQNLNRAWSIVSGASDSHGHRIAGAERIFTLCMSKPKQQTERCLTAHHIFNLAIYQPASRFWLFQGIEAAFFGGLGAALVAGGLWWLRHRVG